MIRFFRSLFRRRYRLPAHIMRADTFDAKYLAWGMAATFAPTLRDEERTP